MYQAIEYIRISLFVSIKLEYPWRSAVVCLVSGVEYNIHWYLSVHAKWWWFLRGLFSCWFLWVSNVSSTKLKAKISLSNQISSKSKVVSHYFRHVYPRWFFTSSSYWTTWPISTLLSPKYTFYHFYFVQNKKHRNSFKF